MKGIMCDVVTVGSANAPAVIQHLGAKKGLLKAMPRKCLKVRREPR